LSPRDLPFRPVLPFLPFLPLVSACYP
jgi:hypothetical protein